MFVGPFFYLDNARISQKGLYADRCPVSQAIVRNRQQVSPVTHQDLLAQITLGADCRDLPRGQVVFDLDSQIAIIYIDHCIERNLAEVVLLFELPAWVVEYDEQYVCPRCEHLADIF